MIQIQSRRWANFNALIANNTIRRFKVHHPAKAVGHRSLDDRVMQGDRFLKIVLEGHPKAFKNTVGTHVNSNNPAFKMEVY